RHPGRGLQGIAGRHEPPDFIEPECGDGEQRDLAVRAVRGIETAAKEPGDRAAPPHLGGRRGETRKPWRASCALIAHAGYSGSSAPIGSSTANSSLLSSIPLAARFCSSCSARLAPTMTDETTGRWSSQASAIAATDTPRASAIGRIASTASKLVALSTRGKSSL